MAEDDDREERRLSRPPLGFVLNNDEEMLLAEARRAREAAERADESPFAVIAALEAEADAMDATTETYLRQQDLTDSMRREIWALTYRKWAKQNRKRAKLLLKATMDALDNP